MDCMDHQKLDKIVKRFQAEHSKHTKLKEKHAALVAQQRQYVALIKVFQVSLQCSCPVVFR